MPFLAWLIPIAKQVAISVVPYVLQKKTEEYFEKRKAKREKKCEEHPEDESNISNKG